MPSDAPDIVIVPVEFSSMVEFGHHWIAMAELTEWLDECAEASNHSYTKETLKVVSDTLKQGLIVEDDG